MKYIRTERIISYRSLYKLRSVGEKIFAVDCFGESYEFIKESDTIEELCDCFAVEETFNLKTFGPSFFGGKVLARFYAEKKREVVGYIIIKKKGVKTLEPVAKTNEKGEFELL